MPELPEVETIVRQLQRKVVGKRITKVRVFDSKVVNKAVRTLVGSQFLQVHRRAKAIIFVLPQHKCLFVRMGMTGHFHYLPTFQAFETMEDKNYVMAAFYFANGSVLTFNEVRKFGFLQMVTQHQLKEYISKMGIEPLGKEFTAEKLRNLLHSRKTASIKVTLMDQQLIAGLGNIYAQEALYRAGIDPRRKVSELSDMEINVLHKAIVSILTLAVQKKGTTVQDYVHIDGSGGFQRYLRVYEREKCPKNHPLRKVYLGGRGTYYCPRCQK